MFYEAMSKRMNKGLFKENRWIWIGVSLFISCLLLGCEVREEEHKIIKQDDFFMTTSRVECVAYEKQNRTTLSKDCLLLKTEVVFHNESKDTIKLRSMSCSYDAEFMVSTTDISIQPFICFANFPITILIPPQQQVARRLNLIWANPTDNETVFSLAYIPHKSLNTQNILDTLWTNTQILNWEIIQEKCLQ